MGLAIRPNKGLHHQISLQQADYEWIPTTEFGRKSCQKKLSSRCKKDFLIWPYLLAAATSALGRQKHKALSPSHCHLCFKETETQGHLFIPIFSWTLHCLDILSRRKLEFFGLIWWRLCFGAFGWKETTESSMAPLSPSIVFMIKLLP